MTTTERRAFVRAAFNHAQTLTPTMDFGSIHLDAPFDGVVVTKDTELSGKDSLSFSFGPCIQTADVCDMVDMSQLNVIECDMVDDSQLNVIECDMVDMSQLNVIECANGALVIDARDAGKAWDWRNSGAGYGDVFAEVGL